MDKPRSLLFIINGYGLGNSTRCHAIIEQLNNINYKVDVVVSGNSKSYFSKCLSVRKVFRFLPIAYSLNKEGKVSILKTVLSLLYLLKRVRRNVKKLKDIVSKQEYCAIITDSDYTSFLAKRSVGIPVIALNNSLHIVQASKYLWCNPSLLLHYMVELSDYLLHIRFANLVICPSIKRIHHRVPANHRIVPPIVRRGILPRKNCKSVDSVLILASSSGLCSPEKYIDFKRFPPDIKISIVGSAITPNPRYTIYPKHSDVCKLINESDIVVTNGGFSSLSELFVSQTPAVVLPVPNHAEQHVNAKIFHTLGHGIIAQESNLTSKILFLVNNFEILAQSTVSSQVSNNGAIIAAELIDSYLNEL